MKLTGGILAGGAGRRFGGADKGWLEFRGRPFIERVRDAVAPQVDEIIISANRNLDRYATLGHVVVRDDVGCGPAAGLLQLLEHARHAWVLCVPCDALALPATLARALLDARWGEDADIALLRDDAGVHPTCCLVPCDLAPDLRRYLAQGRTALWRWQARHRLAHARLDTPFVNVNDASCLAAHAQAGMP